ncbi:ABC transporter ATP-binding protein [Amycolatopsis suaedae]|uniref:ABC transporter ATP-binding protein n=1 Tax=Amycolatopsis suaedae TaxID=2510978 RepID=A0A4Q7JE75_9PSEU|nr:ABC transporter ATP-binding protein [Amycolatopsis suaedae]RZQ64973.1 ABC transporter ATP-binding protein [Amycolatopsis suaedae]
MPARLAGVGKRYGGGGPVLTGVDLEVGTGEVVGIVGRNGSGKSTLLRILAGLSRPSAGTATRSGRVGYLPDRFPGASRMSARAYLKHMARISCVDDRAAELLERLELAGGPDTPIGRLSKGNAQKVGLAQALLGDPELLVLDEPWSGLDTVSHGVLGEIIAETRDRGASVVFTDHRPDLAHRQASRVLELSGGSLRPAHGHRRRIRLTGGTGDWAAEPGVHVENAENGHVDLSVDADRSDAVLLTALRRGWSVREVRE